MKKFMAVSLMLCLALLMGAGLSLAQDLQKISDDTIASMLRDGWKIKQDGVLQRDRGPHQTESFVFGSAGFTWKLQDLQNQLRNLRLAYVVDPKPELRKAILSHRQEIANTQKMIAIAQAAEATGQTAIEKTTCNISFGYSASASSLSTSQGVTGNGSANFSGNCGFTAEVYAYSYSKATVSGALTTKTMTDGPRSGASVTASANTSQTGGPTCESYGYASVTSNNLNPSSYSISATNTSCPGTPPPPVPTITGTNYIYVASGCVSTTWTSSVSGGSSPYTYNWTWNGASVGTGSSYTRSTCAGAAYSYTTNTLGLTVTDSLSRSGSTSKSVDVEKDPTTCFAALTPDGEKIVCP